MTIRLLLTTGSKITPDGSMVNVEFENPKLFTTRIPPIVTTVVAPGFRAGTGHESAHAVPASKQSARRRLTTLVVERRAR